MKNIETQLQSHISKLFDRLEEVEPGSEEYMVLAGVAQNFYDIRNNEIKIHAEEKKAYDENECEKERLKFEKEKAYLDFKMRIIEIGTNIGNHLLDVGSYIQTFKTLTSFEQTGVATSKFWMFTPKLKLF